jgi:hypothetical protein
MTRYPRKNKHFAFRPENGARTGSYGRWLAGKKGALVIG